jgi:hypothetical protein
MSLRQTQSDKRNPPTRNPNINWTTIIENNFKSVLAFIIIILIILILAQIGGSISEGLKTFLFSIGSAAVGFLFGSKK